MAHFAKVENDLVVQVVVVDNEHESYGQQYLNDLGLDGTWIQTSYNSKFGGKFAGIGDTYDSKKKEFVSPVVEVIEPELPEITE
jgi:hypothetical protein